MELFGNHEKSADDTNRQRLCIVHKLRLMSKTLQTDSTNADIAQCYKSAFEETDSAIFISSPEGKCITANPWASTLTGYCKQELVGKELLDLFQQNEDTPTIDRASLCKGKTIRTEGRLLCKDNSLVWIELRIRKLSNGNYLDTARDITEQKLADETLRKNEELFRIAFDHAPTGMSIIAPDGVTYLAVNPLLCEMFGYTREEFLGETIHLVTHPDDEALSDEWIRKKINDEPCDPYLEKRYIHRDGHIVWGLVSAHWIKNDDGSHRMAIAHVQDITERKKAEEDRKRLQTRLAAAMELAHLGHWEYDVESDTFTFNDQFYRIFGTTAERIGGYTLSSEQYASRFLHPDDKAIVEQEIQRLREASSSDVNRKNEHRILYENGTTGYISVQSFIERDEQGRPIRSYGINQDITERKRAEQERSKLEDQVRQAQKMESIGLLAGGVAHDFNNLLTPIIGYTDIMCYELADGDRRKKQLQQIREAAERAKAVVQRLLAFSRKQLLELKTVDLGDVIRRFENVLRRTIRENIEITVKIHPDLYLVKADPGQIEQVLLNLSVNAQDAMPEGGCLVIEAKNIDLKHLHTTRYRTIEPGPYTVLSVSDTGIGIEDNVIEHIFEPFYTTKDIEKGTGLGLSTVYGIVKQHDGLILASSELRVGTTFEVFLPKTSLKEEERIEDDPHPPDEITHGRETILVAEDNAMVRSLTCDMLKELGYTVLEAESPERCIDLAKEHQGDIHLLLTDIIMPKMNGKELYDTLNTQQPNLRVVFMSGYASNFIGDQNIIDRRTNFIQKPFSLHRLSNIIRRTLDSF
jgi:PAS domain S-box-containing protein